MTRKFLSIILSLLCLINLSGQEFKYKGLNLFNLEYIAKDSSKEAIKPFFYDLDADGDQDAIIVGIDKVDSVENIAFNNIHYFIEVQENIGDRWHPLFETRKPFMDNFPYPNGYFFPAIGDLNLDKMPDFIVSSGIDSSLNLETMYYQRKSMTGSDQFNIIGTDSLKLNSFVAGSFMVPDLADMDMDGDLDILMSGFLSVIDTSDERVQKPTFLYAKNTGTVTQPKFLGWYPNPYGLADAIIDLQLSVVGDIDNDNDNDVLSLTTVDTFKVYTFLQNDHTPDGKPNFENFSTLLDLPKAGKTENLFPPSIVDIDGDGDMDLFFVQDLKSSGKGIGFYENGSCTQILDNSISQTDGFLKANLTGVKYQWYDCTDGADIVGATAQTYQPTKSGKYAVKLDNNSGCKNISPCYNFVLSATEDQIISDQITIYPNPTNDYFIIENNTVFAITNISILNSTGLVVKTIKSTQPARISTSGLPPGNYIIEISSVAWKISKKLNIVE